MIGPIWCFLVWSPRPASWVGRHSQPRDTSQRTLPPAKRVSEVYIYTCTVALLNAAGSIVQPQRGERGGTLTCIWADILNQVGGNICLQVLIGLTVPLASGLQTWRVLQARQIYQTRTAVHTLSIIREEQYHDWIIMYACWYIVDGASSHTISTFCFLIKRRHVERGRICSTKLPPFRSYFRRASLIATLSLSKRNVCTFSD